MINIYRPRLAKWQVLELIQKAAPECLADCDRCYEGFLEFLKGRELSYEDGAVAFCVWRNTPIFYFPWETPQDFSYQ